MCAVLYLHTFIMCNQFTEVCSKPSCPLFIIVLICVYFVFVWDSYLYAACFDQGSELCNLLCWLLCAMILAMYKILLTVVYTLSRKSGASSFTSPQPEVMQDYSCCYASSDSWFLCFCSCVVLSVFHWLQSLCLISFDQRCLYVCVMRR